MAGRLWKLRQRFGIAAPRVAVRTQVAWYWRWLGMVFLIASSAALAAWMYDAGRTFAGFDRGEAEQELSRLRTEQANARTELERLRAISDAADSRLSIERTAQQKLAQQLRTMESDNARLREELAIFESMLSSSDERALQALSILRFNVEPDVLPGEYRYRLLLVAAGPRKEKEFQGRVELVVKLNDGTKSAIMTFPEKGESDQTFRLSFKYFHRVEGAFRVNPKARVESVQVRVFETGVGQARATHTATLG
jgi:hypothetical protein